MIPKDVFIIRRSTRPSEDEWPDLLQHCLKSDVAACQIFLKGYMTRHSDLKVITANLNNENDDIEKQFEAFIKHEGGSKYFKDTNSHSLQTFNFKSEKNEDTMLAIGYFKEKQPSVPSFVPGAEEFKLRGKRWEALQHWGDSLGCYAIGLNLHPDNPDLLLGLGRIQMRYTHLFSQAAENLTRVTELRPKDSDALFLLGKTYRQIADSKKIEVKGRSRSELRHIALSFLERSSIISPNDLKISEELYSLRSELGKKVSVDPKSGFFD